LSDLSRNTDTEQVLRISCTQTKFNIISEAGLFKLCANRDKNIRQ